MASVGLSRSAPVAATLAFVCWVGGCSPVNFPLLPQNRSVRSGRETADATGSAVEKRRASDEDRTLYESNFEGESPASEPAPDAGAGTTQQSDTSASAGTTEPGAARRTGDPTAIGADSPPIVVVERDGDTYEFRSGTTTSQPPKTTSREILETVVGALRSSGASSDRTTADASTSSGPSDPDASSGETAPTAAPVELRRLVVDGSSFELHGTARSNADVTAYVTRLESDPEIESLELKKDAPDDDSSGVPFHLTGSYSP